MTSKIKVVSMDKLTSKPNPSKKVKINESEPSTSVEALSKSKPKPSSSNKSSTNYDAMLEGIKQMNDRKGASLVAIKKHLLAGKENLSETQVRAHNTRTLKMVKKAVEDGILVEKGKLRYGFSEKGKAVFNSEKKKKEKLEKKKEKDLEKKSKAGKKETKKKLVKKAVKGSDASGKKKKVSEKKDEEKKKPLIKGAKARKSLAKVSEMNKKRRSTVVATPKPVKKATKKAAKN